MTSNDPLPLFFTRSHVEGQHGEHQDCGHDVAVVEGSCNYSDALDTAHAYRRTPGCYAVVAPSRQARTAAGCLISA